MRRWSWIAVIVVGAALFEISRRVLLETQNPNLVPSIILLGAMVAPAAFVAFVSTRRLAFGVNTGTVALIGYVGGVVGVLTAGVLEFDALRRLGVLPMLGVGAIEEAAKLIAPLAVLLFTRHRMAADGLLVGVASGAGFATLETMGYGFVVLLKSGGNLAEFTDVLLFRGITSPAAHMAWTGLTAAALWSAAVHQFSGRSVLLLIGTYLLAVILHTTWDSVGSVVVYVVLAVIGLGLLTWVAHRLPHRTRPAQPLST